MAANVAIQDAAVDELALGPPPRRRMSGRKLILFIVLPILLVGGGVGGAIATGLVPFGDAAGHAGDAAPVAPDPATLVFHDLPEMLVNLNATGKRPSFLKMRVSLELGEAGDVAHIQKLAPRVIDGFQVYLRELRADDLRGSAGISRLKEELLRRVNAAVAPVRVRDVLFREMLVQ